MVNTFLVSLSEFIEQKKREERNVETRLLNLFTLEDFQTLDLPLSAFPKMLRGLPRIYDKLNPSFPELKAVFKNEKELFRQYIDKVLLHLYNKITIKPSTRLTLFTHMLPHHKEDLLFTIAYAKYLKEKISAKISIVSLVPHEIKDILEGIEWHQVVYQSLNVSCLKAKQLKILRGSDYILQIGHHFEGTELLEQKIEKTIDRLGDYGSIDTKWFHPQENARSLGLYFLEKGIFTLPRQKLTIDDFKTLKVKSLIFKGRVTQKVIEKYLFHKVFNYADLLSFEGVYLYLKAVLDKRKSCSHDLDFYFSNSLPLIEFFKERDPESFFHAYDIASVEIVLKKEKFKIKLATKGKKVKFICDQELVLSDVQTLVLFSRDLVGVKDSYHLTEAISQNAMYFFDAPDYYRYFLKDLASIAKHYLGVDHPSVEWIKLFSQILKKPKQNGLYVEEDFFQKKSSLDQLAKKSASLLKNPKTVNGIKKLNVTLPRYHSFNDFAVGLVKRGLLINQNAEIERYENNFISELVENKINFSGFINKMKLILSSY